jgi:pSer/pThr/pTyr-binding forkhead associated (FHA) protein
MRLDEGWAIVDLGSTNGTRVNGEPVERRRLRDGDVIEIGLVRLVYHEPRG